MSSTSKLAALPAALLSAGASLRLDVLAQATMVVDAAAKVPMCKHNTCMFPEIAAGFLDTTLCNNGPAAFVTLNSIVVVPVAMLVI